MDLFWSLAHLHGGPAPVRGFLPELIDLIWNRQIDPGTVVDLELPLDEAAACYEAMDERRAIKGLLRPCHGATTTGRDTALCRFRDATPRCAPSPGTLRPACTHG